jgi:hypothetical protein
VNRASDPFEEQARGGERRSYRVLGFPVDVQSAHAGLLALADQAFGRPARRAKTPRVPLVQLRLATSESVRWRAPPAPRLASGAGLVGCSFDADNHAWIAPALGRATVSVSREMLRFPYHARYELIEFAVLTLLTRMHGLVPLHAACVGQGGRAVLLIGDSGAGKSTTCLQALADGMLLVAEDSVFVRPDTLAAAGLNTFLHLRLRGARFERGRLATALRRAPRIRRRSGVHKLELDLRKLGMVGTGRPLSLGAIVLLSPRAAKHGSALEPIGSRRLRAALAATQPYARRQPGWRKFCARAAKLPGFAMRRTEPARVIAELQRLLATTRSRA